MFKELSKVELNGNGVVTTATPSLDDRTYLITSTTLTQTQTIELTLEQIEWIAENAKLFLRR